jgi:hypothetical protein
MTTVRPAVFVSVNIVLHCRLLVAFIKLSHVIAGVYMFVFLFNDRDARALISSCDNPSWETVITTGFELDVLRGKRPYRWTIWVSALHHTRPCCHLNESSYTSAPATPTYLPSSSSLISTGQGLPVT